ncbi:MAG: efflux RND transporter permease subunit [Planctomycetaceae bacterium]
MSEQNHQDAISQLLHSLIGFFLHNKLIFFLGLSGLLLWAMVILPFDYEIDFLPRDPVPVDAIPDIGENQQIVFTKWPGRSPQDVEDQVTYPLTVSMLGVPGVKTVRSFSYLGFSTIYVVFNEEIDFYWSRSRILEQLNVAQKQLPAGVIPSLGPDATALGQVFWYTLEGRDPQTGKPVGGWDLDELRSVQDWNVRYALQSVDGVSEVASVGGFVREYQIDVNPDLMRHHKITLAEVYAAVRRSNVDVGARTIEVNRVEYVIRGIGFLKGVEDLRNTVITERNNVPIYLRNVAHISLGPALRRGALDKGGAEAVGGVVVVRYGENPLEAIKRVKQKASEISTALPKRTLADGRVSQITIVPFYDRTQLIHETLGTLESALTEQMMITVIVVIVMVMHLRSSLLISSLLPLAVGLTFIAMKIFGVDSNLMSLSGIAIAIGTMVDMGVILCENMLRRLEEREEGESTLTVIHHAAVEVGRPVLTAILTTVVGFLPVFALSGPEGKLFKPLAYTKTFALITSVLVALFILPPLAHIVFSTKLQRRFWRTVAGAILGIAGVGLLIAGAFTGWPVVALGAACGLWSVWIFLSPQLPEFVQRNAPGFVNTLAVLWVLVMLTQHWMPLSVSAGFLRNLFFIGALIATLLSLFLTFHKLYEPLLRFFLRHKLLFMTAPFATVLLGVVIWRGFSPVLGFLPRVASMVGIDESQIKSNPAWVWAAHSFPGLGREFMPPLDEGSFLYMPTTMPHASIGEVLEIIRQQDKAITAIPEVESAVGKIGRVDSALDPAPISMVETIITYKPEYGPPDPETGERKRNWRPHIRTTDDIWKEIEKAGQIPGTTGAPKLQPIAARIVMLQSGIRAPMAVRILGDDQQKIERVGMQIEKLLKEVPSVEPKSVNADRLVGKPYLEIHHDRKAIARYGIRIRDVQDVIETAIGGQMITETVEGRERYPVRVRYQRELRDSLESIENILVAAKDGSQIPLKQIAQIRYVRGPQAVKSENSRYVGYVIFDMKSGYSEVDVVEACRDHLDQKMESGELILPVGVEKPTFIGSYENQVRSTKTLAIVIPLAMLLIFVLLYLQFRSTFTTLLVWSGVLVACSGGMIMIWLYSTSWFGDIAIFDVHLRQLFQIRPINLSVAVWVGFIALVGIATDDGVVMATYLTDTFRSEQPKSKQEIREATVQAGLRRIRPCLMTTATTILALLPVLTSRGRGSDVMVPMAIPTFGGMMLELMTLFVVPISFCWIQEWKSRLKNTSEETIPEK